MTGRCLFAVWTLLIGHTLALGQAGTGGIKDGTVFNPPGNPSPPTTSIPKQTTAPKTPAKAAQPAPKKAQAAHPAPKGAQTAPPIQTQQEYSNPAMIPVLGSAAATGVLDLKVFHLRHALPEHFAQIIQQILAAPGRVVNVAIDPRTNSVIVSIDPDLMPIVEALAARLDVPDGWRPKRR